MEFPAGREGEAPPQFVKPFPLTALPNVARAGPSPWINGHQMCGLSAATKPSWVPAVEPSPPRDRQPSAGAALPRRKDSYGQGEKALMCDPVQKQEQSQSVCSRAFREQNMEEDAYWPLPCAAGTPPLSARSEEVATDNKADSNVACDSVVNPVDRGESKSGRDTVSMSTMSNRPFYPGPGVGTHTTNQVYPTCYTAAPAEHSSNTAGQHNEAVRSTAVPFPYAPPLCRSQPAVAKTSFRANDVPASSGFPGADRRRSSMSSQKITGMLQSVRRASSTLVQTLTGRRESLKPSQAAACGNEPHPGSTRRRSRVSEAGRAESRVSFPHTASSQASGGSSDPTEGWGFADSSGSPKAVFFRGSLLSRARAKGSSTGDGRHSRASFEEPEEYSIYFGGHNDSVVQPLQTLEIFGEASRKAEEIRAQRHSDDGRQEGDRAGLRSILITRSSQTGTHGSSSARPSSRSMQNRVRFTEINELREYNPHETFQKRGTRAISEHPLLASLRHFLFRVQSDKRSITELAEKVDFMSERTSAVSTVIDACVHSIEDDAKRERVTPPRESVQESTTRLEDAHKQFQADLHQEQRKTKLIFYGGSAALLLLFVACLSLLGIYIADKRSLENGPCDLTEWTEWSACLALCGPGTSFRSRSARRASSAECPALLEARECTGPCSYFVVAASTPDPLPRQAVERFKECSPSLGPVLRNAVPGTNSNARVTSAAVDYSTGHRVWNVQLNFWPVPGTAAYSFAANAAVDPNRVVRNLEEALADPSTPASKAFESCLPTPGVYSVTFAKASSAVELAEPHTTCDVWPQPSGVAVLACRQALAACQCLSLVLVPPKPSALLEIEDPDVIQDSGFSIERSEWRLSALLGLGMNSTEAKARIDNALSNARSPLFLALASCRTD
ncbi:hypothetical protein BESB_068330 [Besnoitia besnoiti]|uniref:Transmembrane protein n=1 Tax=Besnoitia besnoiti TaxID=94643 RepID=A0A2A9MH99_BESBE|nr:hypothetical protein BESB_068330 [Besnoitia besnoiti]PFH34800.1 hypothetical protein BESB_068330 [Besnoitia besnoiti]